MYPGPEALVNRGRCTTQDLPAYVRFEHSSVPAAATARNSDIAKFLHTKEAGLSFSVDEYGLSLGSSVASGLTAAIGPSLVTSGPIQYAVPTRRRRRLDRADAPSTQPAYRRGSRKHGRC